MDKVRLEILDCLINKTDYEELLLNIKYALENKKQITITGANVSTINLSIKDKVFKKALEQIDIVHPDGVGVYLASKFLYGEKGFNEKITGSDFYVELIKYSLKNNLSFFFLGDTEETLLKISQNQPDLITKGFCNGFNFDSNELVKRINNSNTDILIVGMGSPKQENWIINNKEKIQTKVLITVGEGIRVFAGTKKRGIKLVQTFGFEWLVRLVNEPKRLWKRYLIGNPLFLMKIFRYKLSRRGN